MATIEPVGVAGEAHAHLDLLPTADIAVPGWRGLESEQRWEWFQQLYTAAGHLDRRYRLGLRSGWWEDELSSTARRAGRMGRNVRLRQLD